MYAADAELIQMVEGVFTSSSPHPLRVRVPVGVLHCLAAPRRQPLWLLPRDAYAGVPLVTDWRPHGLSARVKWSLLLGAYRAGLARLVPGVGAISIPLPTRADWQAVGWDKTFAPHVAVLISTRGPGHKAILMLAEERGCPPRMVAKVPLVPTARQAILNEAGVLAALAYRHIPNGCVPEVLWQNDTEGRTLQTYLKGRTGSVVFGGRCADFLSALRNSEALSMSALVDEVTAAYGPDGLAQDPSLAELLDGLRDHGLVPGFVEHGDFSPANIRRLDGGALGVVDWETGRLQGWPLYDLAYFHLRIAQQIKGMTIARSFRHLISACYSDVAGVYVDGLGLDAGRIRGLIALSFLRYWKRHHIDVGPIGYLHGFLRDRRRR